MQAIIPGICLYTVRHSLRKDLTDTLQLLAAVGYRSVELYGSCNEVYPQKLKQALQGSGMSPVAWQMEWSELMCDNTADTLNECGCHTAVVSTLFDEQRLPTEAELMAKIDELNVQAVRFAKDGIRLGCHTSVFAFRPSQRESDYQLMLRRLAPEVLIELDTGNCLQAGGDPCQAIAQCSDHPLYIHMKPYSRDKLYNVVLGEEDDMSDWAAILESGKGRVEQWLIEGACNSLQEMHVACLSLDHFKRLLNNESNRRDDR